MAVVFLNSKELCLLAQDCHKTKQVNNYNMSGEGSHEAHSLAEELMAVHGCRGGVRNFSLGMGG